MNSPAHDPNTVPTTSEPLAESPASLLISVRQLALLPLAIVLIAVLVGLLFGRLAYERPTAQELIHDLHDMGGDRWRKAYLLALLLQDPGQQALRNDQAFCLQLANILASENSFSTTDPDRVRLRVFLCRLLGEFQTADGLPALAGAAGNRDWSTEARLAALEAIATLAGNVGADRIIAHADALNTVVEISHEEDRSSSPAADHLALRSTAAYTLGMMGTPEATARLVSLLHDPAPTVRFNAATGLARQADPRAVPVLVEMLDPSHMEPGPDDPDTFHQQLTLSAAIAASKYFAVAEQGPATEQLTSALRAASNDPRLGQALRLAAKEASLRLVTNSNEGFHENESFH